jgi:hypothetical protein
VVKGKKDLLSVLRYQEDKGSRVLSPVFLALGLNRGRIGAKARSVHN